MSPPRLPGNFFGRQIGETKWPADMDEMVRYWISAWAGDDRVERAWAQQLASDLTNDDPNLGLDFVFSVLDRNPSTEVAGFLVAGPLEDLLDKHGAVVIERVEAKATQQSEFRDLL